MSEKYELIDADYVRRHRPVDIGTVALMVARGCPEDKLDAALERLWDMRRAVASSGSGLVAIIDAAIAEVTP